LDIFFTQRYQYTLEEDADIAAARLLSAVSGPGFRGTIQAENGFRLGHPWRIIPSPWLDTQLAYLSGLIDHLPPRKLPAPDPEGNPVYAQRATIDIRIRPNLFLVIITYCITLLLALDLLGIELFWRSDYLLRLGLYVCLEITSVWMIFFVTKNLKKRFEKIMSRIPTLFPAGNPL
jgi:hypothetical protein